MKPSYTLTPVLTDNIEKIHFLRSEILLFNLTKQQEIELRYESMIDRIYWSLNFVEPSITKSEVTNILKQHFGLIDANSNKKYKKPNEKLILGYKKALDYIENNWYVQTGPIDINCIQKLLSLLELNSSLKGNPEIVITVKYLNESSSDPIIKAGIAQITIIMSHLLEDGNGRLARLISYLILSKYGLDFRGLLVLDEYLRKDIAVLEVIKKSIRESRSLNIWLEHYTTAIVIQLKKSLDGMKEISSTVHHNYITRLNDRQKKIIDVSLFPHASITNKKVQSICNVSQITASRDLAKLASIGLLVPHGKGRSVYYTRA